MLEGFQHLLIYILIGLSKVISSLRVSQNYIFYAGIYQHSRSDLAGVGSALLKIHILCANLNVSSLAGLYHRNDVDGRNTEYYVYFFICYQRFQFLYQSNCLAWGFVHLPVACDNFLSCHFFSLLKLYEIKRVCSPPLRLTLCISCSRSSTTAN